MSPPTALEAREESTPILVGVAQLTQRDVDLAAALDPLEMLVRVSRAAVRDAKADEAEEKLLARLDTVAVVDSIGWRVLNAPRMLTVALGAKPSRELRSGVGGEVPVAMLNDLAQRIAEGRSELALLAGCNNLRTLVRARKESVRLDWPTDAPGTPMADALRETLPGSSEIEQLHGLQNPTQVYPIFENALRVRLGLDLEAHRARMGALFHPFTKVASSNPYAWFPIERSAEELVTVTPRNRMVGFPYTKYLNAVMETDQAAGVLLMSAAAARRYGVPEEKWVYWRGGADAVEEAWFPAQRPDHGACPAMKASHEAALERAGLGLDEMDRFDFYSCFPSAVGMACEMLDLAIDDPRGLTVTGGLPYAGGPGNDYCTHAIAAMATELREGRGRNGLVTGNGWYLTKHAAVVLSAVPPERALAPAGEAPQPAGMPTAPVPMVEEASGAGTVLTYTILYGRSQAPERGIVIGELASGERFVANTPSDRETLEALAVTEVIGRRGTVRPEDGRNLFEPS